MKATKSIVIILISIFFITNCSVLLLETLPEKNTNSEIDQPVDPDPVDPDPVPDPGADPDPVPDPVTPEVTATPTFDPAPSVLSNPVDVQLSSETSNATIYFTLDGSEPSDTNPSTQEYTDPVQINPGTLLKANAVAEGMELSTTASGYYSQVSSDVQLGVNVSWFNTWNESQPLANVASSGRSISGAIPVDQYGQPNSDFNIVLYEGNTPGQIGGAGGGAQFGTHTARFIGQADVSANGGTISNYSWNPSTNISTFLFTTTEATNSVLYFSNTQRTASSASGSGIQDLEVMRPGQDYNDLINTAFVQAMEPFSSFRVGPNWDDLTYSTTSPVWSERGKPDGIHNPISHNDGLAPWETLIAMANQMETDLWISLPPYADENYLTKLFQVFYYGSDGIEPYTSYTPDPVWAPLDPERKLYFEVGNEIWNTAPPYGTITNYMRSEAVAEVNAGDPNNLNYAEMTDDGLMRRRYAQFIAIASQICRDVVGDSEMMSRFRPVVSGQSAFSMIGESSISYLRCVLGGHNWYTNWGAGFPGKYIPGDLHTPEDGVSVNPFGNVARPLSYWIYGYAIAPYINGDSTAELSAALNDSNFGGPSVKQEMSDAIAFAHEAGIEALAYEGGIERYNSYTEAGLDTVLEDQLNHWFSEGGGTFMYYAFAGNTGSGIYPDLTKQDPAIYPKIRAVRNIAGLD